MPKATRNPRRWLWPGVLGLALLSSVACRKRAPKPTDSTAIDQPHPPDQVAGATPIATLERTGCYGECPVYRLTVSSDGSVVYVGTRWVKVLGRQQYKLTDTQLSELQSAFEHATFMQMRDYDRVENTDDDWAHVSYRRGNIVKRVRHYHGDNSAPAALSALEDEFDRIVDSGRFIGVPSANGAALAPSSASAIAPMATDSTPVAAPPKPPARANENAGPPDDTVADPDNHP
ncbi:MAG TPA: DUF6438 domain-containing protein [Polyangiaceae bacterium]